MKIFLRLFAAFFAIFFTVVEFTNGEDFVSTIVQAPLMISVGPKKSLVIRNFTQAGGSTRGTIQVAGSTSTGTFSVNPVLTASLMDSSSPEGFQEPVNEIVIAGPATVTVTAGDQACFITYRKVDE